MAIIILGNSNNVVLSKTQEKILELMLPLKPKENSPVKKSLPMTEGEMASYAGIYNQPNRFKIEVYTRDGNLFIKEFNKEMPLSKTGENKFSFQFPGAPQLIEIYMRAARGAQAGFIHQYVWAFKKIG